MRPKVTKGSPPRKSHTLMTERLPATVAIRSAPVRGNRPPVVVRLHGLALDLFMRKRHRQLAFPLFAQTAG